MSNVPVAHAATARDVLRHSTRAIHERLERSLHLLAPDLTVLEYTGVLRSFLNVHAALERRIAPQAAALVRLGVNPVARRKSALLERDLAALDGSYSSLSPRVEPFKTVAAALGALYVIEGSTLGGVVICRHVEKTLALGSAGTSFFRGHGAATGARWKDFCILLDRTLVDSGDVAAAVTAATSAFHMFVAELEGFVPCSA